MELCHPLFTTRGTHMPYIGIHTVPRAMLFIFSFFILVISIPAGTADSCFFSPIVTPGFKGKSECKNTCAPDQVTHMHRRSEYQKHSVKRKESIKQLLHDQMSQLNKTFE
jgi:hypothetical protein